MRRPQWLALILAGLVSAAFAAPEGGGEPERNRRLLEKYRADPEHHRRLKRDLAAFHALPAERQQQIRDLDRRIHEADPATQARLWGVIERYNAWLEQLPEDERQAVLQAKNKIAVIQALRDREWLERLPRAIQKELSGLFGDKLRARLAELRAQEHYHRVHWQRPQGAHDLTQPHPKGFDELPREAQAFLNKEVLPRSSGPEKDRLKELEGRYPDYPRHVAWLADRYPVLPEGPLGKITSAEKLPPKVRERFERSGNAKQAARLEGKWPDYACAVSYALRNDRELPPLGASRLDEFPPRTKGFVRNRLLPLLSIKDRADLDNAEGRWPEYPRRLLLLARRYQLVIPDMSLPAPEVWELARLARLEHGRHEALEAFARDPKLRKNVGELLIKMGDMKKKPPGKPGWPGKGHR
jgi:hypothetical protein